MWLSMFAERSYGARSPRPRAMRDTRIEKLQDFEAMITGISGLRRFNGMNIVLMRSHSQMTAQAMAYNMAA